MIYIVKKENLGALKEIGAESFEAVNKIDTFYSKEKIEDPFKSPIIIKRRIFSTEVELDEDSDMGKLFTDFFYAITSRVFDKKTCCLLTGTSETNIQYTPIENWGPIDFILRSQNITPQIEDNQLDIVVRTTDSCFQIIKHEGDSRLYVCFLNTTAQSLELIKEKLKLEEWKESSWIKANASKLI